jgi:hypothetical protein
VAEEFLDETKLGIFSSVSLIRDIIQNSLMISLSGIASTVELV